MITRKTVAGTIGKSFADKFDDVVFTLGQHTYTRQRMIDLKCASFWASGRLTKVLKRLEITTPGQLFKLGPSSLNRIKGVGDACLYVAMCVLDDHGYSVAEWWGWKEKRPRRLSRHELPTGKVVHMSRVVR